MDRRERASKPFCHEEAQLVKCRTIENPTERQKRSSAEAEESNYRCAWPGAVGEIYCSDTSEYTASSQQCTAAAVGGIAGGADWPLRCWATKEVGSCFHVTHLYNSSTVHMYRICSCIGHATSSQLYEPDMDYCVLLRKRPFRTTNPDLSYYKAQLNKHQIAIKSATSAFYITTQAAATANLLAKSPPIIITLCIKDRFLLHTRSTPHTSPQSFDIRRRPMNAIHSPGPQYHLHSFCLRPNRQITITSQNLPSHFKSSSSPTRLRDVIDVADLPLMGKMGYQPLTVFVRTTGCTALSPWADSQASLLPDLP